jgi:hypothetical protein
VEFAVALASVAAAIALFWIALPGRPLNAWLVKHPSAEAFFLPFLLILLMMAAVAMAGMF